MIGDTQLRQVAVPVADLRAAPGGARLRQALYGEVLQPLEPVGDHVLVEARKDGYRGIVTRAELGPAMAATHWVTAPATHLYAAASIKSPDLMPLSFGAQLTVLDSDGPFSRTHAGFVPSVHLQPLRRRFSDPMAVAELFLGTPYLWGGNSRAGIDCSGLVQAACLACGLPCPGDSGDQAREAGTLLPPGTAPARGDLIFWKGHVAMVAGPDRLIHANAAYMSVVYEGLGEAVARIRDQGEGEVTAHRRLPCGA